MECSKCHEDKPEKAFATFRSRKGELRRRGECWACRGKYAFENFERLQQWRKEYNAKNRTKKSLRDKELRQKGRALVDAFKDKPCADCGVKYPPVAMDLDHVRGGKIRSVSSLVGSGYRIELILEELKKCEVVCSNCHRIRTHEKGENLAPRAAAIGRKRTSPI